MCFERESDTRPEHINFFVAVFFFCCCCCCCYLVICLCVCVLSSLYLYSSLPDSTIYPSISLLSFYSGFLLLFVCFAVCVFCVRTKFNCICAFRMLVNSVKAIRTIFVYLSFSFFISRMAVAMVVTMNSSTKLIPCALALTSYAVQYTDGMEWNVVKNVSKLYVVYIKWLTQAKKRYEVKTGKFTSFNIKLVKQLHRWFFTFENARFPLTFSQWNELNGNAGNTQMKSFILLFKWRKEKKE